MSQLKNNLNVIYKEIQEKLLPENIKKDVSILGVTGTLEPINNQEKTVIATITEQSITPDEGFNGLSKVVIPGVTNEIDSNILPENIKSGITILGVTGTYTGEKSTDNTSTETTQSNTSSI